MQSDVPSPMDARPAQILRDVNLSGINLEGHAAVIAGYVAPRFRRERLHHGEESDGIEPAKAGEKRKGNSEIPNKEPGDISKRAAQDGHDFEEEGECRREGHRRKSQEKKGSQQSP